MEKDDGSKKALIIAVSHYDTLQPLSFCMNDGNEMLTAHYSTRLLNAKFMVGIITAMGGS